MFALWKLAAHEIVLWPLDTAYEQCTEEQIDYVTDSIAANVAGCTKKTGYDFVDYPLPTEKQTEQFCTECADLVANIKVLTPAKCSLYVFSPETPTSLKVAIETLFGKCGVTNVQEADAAGAAKSEHHDEKHEHGSGSHDSDDARKTRNDNSTTVEKTKATPVPSPVTSSGVVASTAVVCAASVVATTTWLL